MTTTNDFRTWLTLATVPLAFAAWSCVIDDDEPRRAVVVEPSPPRGTLVVRWTINRLTDPNECARTASANIEIGVFDPAGRELSAWQAPCTFFSTSITLGPGSYFASAVLLDAANQRRSTGVPIDPFTLLGNDVLDVAVDFPFDSFF
jgi:hypothetical protein